MREILFYDVRKKVSLPKPEDKKKLQRKERTRWKPLYWRTIRTHDAVECLVRLISFEEKKRLWITVSRFLMRRWFFFFCWEKEEKVSLIPYSIFSSSHSWQWASWGLFHFPHVNPQLSNAQFHHLSMWHKAQVAWRVCVSVGGEETTRKPSRRGGERGTATSFIHSLSIWIGIDR